MRQADQHKEIGDGLGFILGTGNQSAICGVAPSEESDVQLGGERESATVARDDAVADLETRDEPRPGRRFS